MNNGVSKDKHRIIVAKFSHKMKEINTNPEHRRLHQTKFGRFQQLRKFIVNSF